MSNEVIRGNIYLRSNSVYKSVKLNTSINKYSRTIVRESIKCWNKK